MARPRSQPKDPLTQEFDAWLEQLGDTAPPDSTPAERPTSRLNEPPHPPEELCQRLARLIVTKEQHFNLWAEYLPTAQLAAWKEELEELRALQVLARRL